MSYTDVLVARYLGKDWYIVNDDYDTLVWNDESPKPTREELEALSAEVEAELVHARIAEERKAAYENEADPLFFYWQAGKGTKEAWEEKRAEIDARYPYP